MAKPTKYAGLICAIITVLAVIGTILAFFNHAPLVLVLFLFPAIAYEVYRTEGKSTRWASWMLAIVFGLEMILIIFHINFDIATFLGKSETVVAGYNVPLGDIQIVGPSMIAILSIILFARTRGVYTKWLAVVIILASLCLIDIINPVIFQSFLKVAIDQGLEQIK